jgi:hypothetical protein
MRLTKEEKALIINKRPMIEKLRIRDEEIHAYGQMPNSNVFGWWFLTYVYDFEIKGIDAI